MSDAYDNAGNLINDGTAAHIYDALNRTTVRGGTTYGYNGDGTLVSQATGGVTTRYTQDLAAPLSQVLQTKVGAAAITDYFYGMGRLASLNGSTKTWYAADALGSVRRTVTDAGTPLGVINYDPWGTPESGTVPTFGFTGEVQDVSAGLVNLRARWYSTARGRFTSVDPFAGMMETPYSLHQYQYGYADPVLNRDPSGRDPKDLPCQPFDLLDPTNPNTCKTKPVTSPLPPGGAPSPTSAPGVPPGVSQPRNPHPVSLPDAADQLIADMRYYSNTPEAGTVQYFVGLSHLFVLPDCAFNRIATLPGLIAYKLWRDYVKDKAPLDVKKRYERDYGRYMPMFGDTWDNQLSGNLLFGFVGMHVGFTEAELLNGAGLAQYAAHCLDKYQPGSMGPGAEDCGVVSSSFRASSAIMFGIIADDNQVKDDERTELIGKGPDLVRFGAELAKEPFQQVG